MKERIVMFDVDSTLVKIEGLDFLGQQKSPEVQREIEILTELAMNGEIPNEVAMERKMELLKPSRQDMDLLAQEYKATLTDDAQAVIQDLQKARIQIGILTGNFVQSVFPLAEVLGIPLDNVRGNVIQFDDEGKYLGYEARVPFTANGKAGVIKDFRPRFGHITMIGDGSTDLETKPVVDKFIGFGGIRRRSSVEAGSKVYITSPSLAPVILEGRPLLRRGVRRLRRDALVQKARSAEVIRR